MHGEQERWPAAATASVAVGHGTFNVAGKNRLHERFTLCNGIYWSADRIRRRLENRAECPKSCPALPARM